ncbi:hypothetical protein EVAR_30313_1 [Eumeta japonica]|uniref:Uncharacterized protein n=1 Tax=Eumeta variegata TaxID=151549 RepID=A0A4C1WAQ8_EUMVA|nr:hypothetical protein EVAR_30313_1 [Eumeta japonica]
MKKLCSRWIPHDLTEAQETDCVTWCNAMLTRFKKEATKAKCRHSLTEYRREVTDFAVIYRPASESFSGPLPSPSLHTPSINPSSVGYPIPSQEAVNTHATPVWLSKTHRSIHLNPGSNPVPSDRNPMLPAAGPSPLLNQIKCVKVTMSSFLGPRQEDLNELNSCQLCAVGMRSNDTTCSFGPRQRFGGDIKSGSDTTSKRESGQSERR